MSDELLKLDCNAFTVMMMTIVKGSQPMFGAACQSTVPDYSYSVSAFWTKRRDAAIRAKD